MNRAENIFNNLKAQIDKISKHNNQGSYKTRERYAESVGRFCKFIAKEFGTQKFINIQDKHVDAYINNMQDRELSSSHIKAELSAIRFYHDKANGKYKLGEFNTGTRRFGGVPRAWTQQEFKSFNDLCNKRGATRVSNIASLAKNEGLRLHEAIRLDRATVESALNFGRLHVKGKGGKERDIPLSLESRVMLSNLIEGKSRGQKLFVEPGEKTHLVMKQVQNYINRNREHYQDSSRSMNITFHGLRHAFAQSEYCKAIDRGASEIEARLYVSNLLGHERDDVTRIYLAIE